MLLFNWLIGPISMIALGVPSLASDEQTGASSRAEAVREPPNLEIDRLIEQLDARQYSVRETATQRLEQLGVPAIPPLTRAAVAGDSFEVAMRVIRIFKMHVDGDDPASRTAAADALREITKSEKLAVAQAARHVLEAQPNPSRTGSAGNLVFDRQHAHPPGARRSVSVHVINGVRTTHAEEDEQSIRIEDDPQRGIFVDVTDRKTRVMRRVTAKNAEELREKHPDMFSVYDRYKNQAMLRPAVQPQIPHRPAQQDPKQVPFVPTDAQTIVQLIQTRKKLDDAIRMVKEYAANPDKPAELAAAMTKLEEARAECDAILQRLAPVRR